MNRSITSRSTRTAVLFTAFLALGALQSTAEARPDATVEVQALRRDVKAVQLFQALNLSAQQRTSLAPMLTKAAASRTKLEALKADAAEKEAKALKEALEGFDRSGSLPADLEQRLSASSAPAIKTAENDLRLQLDQIVSRLTPAQRDVLANFDTDETAKAGDAANKAYALRQLDRVRVLPDLKLDARMAKLEAQATAPGASPKLGEQLAEVKQLTYDIRAIPASDWRAEREKLAAEADPQVLKLMQRLAEDDVGSKQGGKSKDQRQLEKSSQLLATDAFVDAVNTRR